MAQVENFDQYLKLADQLVSVATKEDLAEALKLIAMIVAHYQSKYGDLPLDEVLEVAYADEPNEVQLQMTADGMEVLVGVLGGIVQGFEPKLQH